MRVVASLLLLAACLGLAAAQPPSCIERGFDLVALMGMQADIDANCPKGAPTCSEACQKTLGKASGGGGRRVDSKFGGKATRVLGPSSCCC